MWECPSPASLVTPLIQIFRGCSLGCLLAVFIHDHCSFSIYFSRNLHVIEFCFSLRSFASFLSLHKKHLYWLFGNFTSYTLITFNSHSFHICSPHSCDIPNLTKNQVQLVLSIHLVEHGQTPSFLPLKKIGSLAMLHLHPCDNFYPQPKPSKKIKVTGKTSKRTFNNCDRDAEV